MKSVNIRAVAVPLAIYAALAIVVIPIFPHAVSPNEYSRWIVDAAIVEYGTVEVTPVMNATGIPFTDLSRVGDRYYSNKAPGAALLTLPFYAAARLIFGPPAAETMRATLNVIRLAGATIPAILVALWVGVIAQRFGCDASRARFAATMLLFATPLLAYGLLFFAHALSAVTIFGAWAMLFATPRTRAADVAAGALIGLSVLSEYPSAIPGALLIILALPLLRVAGTLRVMAGGLPFAIILAVYNRIAFGSIFSLSSAHEVDAPIAEMARSGLFGVGLPQPEYLLRLLADPSRGLFVLSPVLLIAIAGLARARRALPLISFIALLAVPAIIILTFAGYPNWFGGRTVGARYLVPALPFLALLIAFAAETVTEKVLAGASVATVAILSLVFPFVPMGYDVPWVSFSWPLLRSGCVAPNVFHLISNTAAVIAPFAITGLALALSMRARHLPLALAGAVLWFAAGFLAESRKPSPPHLVALTEEVHFERDGVIASRFDPRHPFTRQLQAVADAQKRLPPPPWPRRGR